VVGFKAMNELIAASTELAVALDETRQMYIDAQSSHCNTLNVATRVIQSCIYFLKRQGLTLSPNY
jgi:hypothetical protein